MSVPIDYIDLTTDLPDQPSKLRNKDEIYVNLTVTKSRKRGSKKQVAQLEDSIIEITNNSRCKDVQTMEIIDLDNTNSPKETGICYVNDTREKKLVVLTCPICYEQLSSKMKPMSTPCGHIFCTKCITLALRVSKSKKCPTCQRIIKLQSCTRLYF